MAIATEASCDGVLAVGGGAVLDCGKAAAAMLSNGGPLIDYLEGVGSGRQVTVAPVSLIAVPTTAGTGSEVTKNAVISGPDYKKSLRSPLMIPRVALVDPELTLSMPPEVTASCGMDALTQLIEAYLSRGASPLTDGLALQGIAAAGRSGALLRAVQQGDDAGAREQMALASLLGGITLANAGLGAVHGFASPLGALFPIPHGVACAALLPQVVRANLEASRGTEHEQRVFGRVCDLAAALLPDPPAQHGERAEAVVEKLTEIQKEVGIPGLGRLGVTPEDFPRIIAGARGSSMRYNPLHLTDEQLEAILGEAF